MEIQIIVAVHKASRLPQGTIFLPVQVGAALHPPLDGLQPDDAGDSISEKNPHYCELTALYWAWKNCPAEYVGLAHYRRYFAKAAFGVDKWKRIEGRTELERALKKADVLLPKKRNYWIETNYSQYVHAHHQQDLTLTRDILRERWPAYLPAYDAVMRRTSGHRFNMFVMRKDILNDYCCWLFDILFELEKRLDISTYSPNDARVFGFVAERLLDVWIETNQIAYTEMPVVFTEKVNWLTKGGAFLRRKFVRHAPEAAAEAAERQSANV